MRIASFSTTRNQKNRRKKNTQLIIYCPLGNSQALKSQSGLYSAIRNRLTTQSKPDLRYSVILCLYAMPLGVGSVNNPCMGSSVCCQAPTNTTDRQEGGREGGMPLIRALCRRSYIYLRSVSNLRHESFSLWRLKCLLEASAAHPWSP